MARGLIRKPSFNKIVGAYRSQWKRFWMRLFTFGAYGSKGMGWWRDPKKAWYNWWYRRSSISVYQILGCKPSRGACFFAMLCAAVIGVVASPVDATRAGVKAHKIKKARKARASGTGTKPSRTNSTGAVAPRTTSGTSRTSSSERGYSSSGRSETYTPTSLTTPKSSSATPKATTTASTTTKTTSSRSSSTPKSTPRTTTTVQPKITYTPPIQEEKPKPIYTFTPSTYNYEPPKPITPPEPVVTEPDENTPKSKPKNEGDQYIRKRMIIAGSYYCDAAVLAKLIVGTYFDLVAEPDNPHDKDAVMLTLDGEKIGYIAKSDRLAFVTCLKLKRKIYGVITAIKEDDGRTQYEFETWFDLYRK